MTLTFKDLLLSLMTLWKLVYVMHVHNQTLSEFI
jgi:hypothetical protein